MSEHKKNGVCERIVLAIYSILLGMYIAGLLTGYKLDNPGRLIGFIFCIIFVWYLVWNEVTK